MLLFARTCVCVGSCQIWRKAKNVQPERRERKIKRTDAAQLVKSLVRLTDGVASTTDPLAGVEQRLRREGRAGAEQNLTFKDVMREI